VVGAHRQAYERDPVAVQARLNKEYPAIHRRTKATNALILWGDVMGLRSDDTVGRAYSPRGRTPIVPATGCRFACSMISANSNLGRLWFMVFSCRFNTDVFIGFLTRLLKSTEGWTIILLIDSHPAHKAVKVARWIKPSGSGGRSSHSASCPATAPSSTEMSCTTKTPRKPCGASAPRDQSHMMANTQAHLRRRQIQPAVLRNFFEEEHVRYAAAAG